MALPRRPRPASRARGEQGVGPAASQRVPPARPRDRRDPEPRCSRSGRTSAAATGEAGPPGGGSENAGLRTPPVGPGARAPEAASRVPVDDVAAPASRVGRNRWPPGRVQPGRHRRRRRKDPGATDQPATHQAGHVGGVVLRAPEHCATGGRAGPPPEPSARPGPARCGDQAVSCGSGARMSESGSSPARTDEWRQTTSRTSRVPGSARAMAQDAVPRRCTRAGTMGHEARVP